MVKWAILLESFLVQHYILSRQIVIEILYDYPNCHTQLEGEMGHYIWENQMSQPNFMLRKRMSGNT